MFRNLLDINSLRTQLILSFIFLVLFTVLATGVPAVVLINSQQNRQAWAQVDQGTRTSQTLLDAKQSELEDLAALTAQRPTLLELLAGGSPLELNAYLTDLQESAGFDLVSVCKLNDEVASYPEGRFPENICLLVEPNGYTVTEGDNGAQAWLLASHSIRDDDENPPQLPNLLPEGPDLTNTSTFRSGARPSSLSVDMPKAHTFTPVHRYPGLFYTSKP